MSQIPYITKAGDLPFQFDLDGNSIAGFICTISVKKRPTDTDRITPRVVDPTDDLWSGFLTTAEIASIAVGRYELIANIQNASTLEGQEKIKRFQIEAKWST